MIRALTVQQPWGHAIIHGGKNVENRTQVWGYRGPLAIHAGRRDSQRGWESPLVRQALGVHEGGVVDGGLEYGAVIGVVDLVDCHPDAGCCSPWGESAYVEHGGRVRRRITHLVLQDPRPLPEPIPCRGALGLWILPPGVAAAVAAALPEVVR